MNTVGNGAVLKSSSQWQLKEFRKLNNSGHELFIIRRNTVLLVTSSFSFSHNVFYSNISLVHQNAALCGNELSDDFCL